MLFCFAFGVITSGICSIYPGRAHIFGGILISVGMFVLFVTIYKTSKIDINNLKTSLIKTKNKEEDLQNPKSESDEQKNEPQPSNLMSDAEILRESIQGPYIRELIFPTPTKKETENCPEVKINNDKKNNRKKICAICKLEIRHTQRIKTCPSCKAQFHYDHLETWLKQYRRCPVCGFRIKKRTTPSKSYESLIPYI